MRDHERRRKNKSMPRVTYRTIPSCFSRRTPALKKSGDCSYPSSLCLPLRIIPGEDNKESFTKSESASQQAVFLFPCDSVSNAFLIGELTYLLPPDGLFQGTKERTCPLRLRQN